MTNLGNERENKIREAILAHPSHNEEWKFEVFDDSGVITLTGTVPSQEEVEMIESIANEQDGVLTVINEIRVDDSTDSTGDNIRPVPPGILGN